MRALIAELRGLSIAEWPLASRQVQCFVMALAVLTWGGLGEVFFFQDIEQALLRLEKGHRQNLQKVDAVQAKIDEHTQHRLAQVDRKTEWQKMKTQWGGYEQPTALIADFHRVAEHYGLSSTFHPLKTNLSSLSSIPQPLVGLDGLAGLHYEGQLTGSLASILSWLDAMSRPNGAGKIWFERWSLASDPISDQFQLTVQLVWLGWLETHKRVHTTQMTALAPPWPSMGDQPFGLGLRDPNWWRVLPIEKLTLAGLGQINRRPFAWVLDPTGQLHSLRPDMWLDEGRWRVDEIGDDGVRLVSPHSTANHLWAWP